MAEYEVESLDPEIVRNFIAEAIRPGDEVRMDLKTYYQLGMQMKYHGRWMRIRTAARTNPARERKPSWPASMHYTADGIGFDSHYGFYEAQIDGWKRPHG